METRRQRWNAFRRRSVFGLNTLLSGVGAIALVLLIVAGICAALARRLSI